MLVGGQGLLAVDELADNILNSRCPFKTLGLGVGTTLDQVKSAYRRLSLVFHPDKSNLPSQVASEVFQALQKAYTAASQHFQPAQQHVPNSKDLWGQFYAAPTPSAPPDEGFRAAPTSGLGAPARPAHAARQGGLWGSARGPVASAWSRQNQAAAPEAPSAAAAPAAVEADAGAGPPMQQDAAAPQAGDVARIAERLKLQPAAAQTLQARVGSRLSRAAMPTRIDTGRSPLDGLGLPGGSPNAPGVDVPAGKRRRVVTGGGVRPIELPPAKAPGPGVAELLRRRRAEAGQQGPAHSGGTGLGSPRPPAGVALSTGRTSKPFLDAVDEEAGAEAAGEAPQPAPATNVASIPAGSAWVRRPVFGVALRQAAHGAPFAEAGAWSCDNSSGGQARQEQRPRRRCSTAGVDMGGARSREWHMSCGPSPDDSYGTDSETSASGSSQRGADGEAPSPESGGGGGASSSSVSEGVWDVPRRGGEVTESAPVAGCEPKVIHSTQTGPPARAVTHCAASSGSTGTGSAHAPVEEREGVRDGFVPPTSGAAQSVAQLWRRGSRATGVHGSATQEGGQTQTTLNQFGPVAAAGQGLPRGGRPCATETDGYNPPASSLPAKTATAPAGANGALYQPFPAFISSGDALGGGSSGGPQRAGANLTGRGARGNFRSEGAAREHNHRAQAQREAHKLTSVVPGSSFYGAKARCASLPTSSRSPLWSGGTAPVRATITSAASRQPLALGIAVLAGIRGITELSTLDQAAGGPEGPAGRATQGCMGPGRAVVAAVDLAACELFADEDRGALAGDVGGDGDGGRGNGGGDGGGDGDGDAARCTQEGGDAAPDDAWWDEPVEGPGGGKLLPLGRGAAPNPSQRHVEDGTGAHTLDMFLEEVQRGGALQAQRAGQVRLSNLRRNALVGRRGRGRGRGGAGGSSRRGGTGSGRRTGGKTAASAPDDKRGRGRSGTADILRYSRPIKG